MPSDFQLTDDQIEASRNWIRQLYKAVDSFDYDYWLKAFCKSDVCINMCDKPPLVGVEQIRAHFEQQKLILSSLKHVLNAIDVLPDRIYVQSLATHVVKKDPKQQEIEIKAIAVFNKKITENTVSSIDIIYDPSPLMKIIEMFS